jgi:L-threonylcarbamoyladenylate synthase
MVRTELIKDVKKAARYILNSEVVAFPTETVYGLGANVFDEKAVHKIYELKNRPPDNPLIVHISSKEQIDFLACEINSTAHHIIKNFFPGPITVILKKHEIVPYAATAGLDTIAIRMPSSRIARELIEESGVPIAAPSANLSGSPSPTSYRHVLQDFNGKLKCILVGPDSKYGIESTVIDCTSIIPSILRPGIITAEDLSVIRKQVRISSTFTQVKSPGQKYKHYAPKAQVVLIKGLKKVLSSAIGGSAYIGIGNIRSEFKEKLSSVRICSDLFDYAKHLFSFFRECDKNKIKTIYCQEVPEKGIGLAIMNRLKKAAG